MMEKTSTFFKILFLTTFLVSVVFTSVAMAEKDSWVASNTNPTNKLITPRRDQTPQQQNSDQADCYDQVCDDLEWDPYEAYDDLADQGFAVALDAEEMERGLVSLAIRGAVVGSVIGETLGGEQEGTAAGAAVGLASGIIQNEYLTQPDDPRSRRVVARFERNLRKWETRFSSCMSRKGYRVHSD